MQEIIDQSSEGAMRLLVASVRSADDMATLAEGVRISTCTQTAD